MPKVSCVECCSSSPHCTPERCILCFSIWRCNLAAVDCSHLPCTRIPSHPSPLLSYCSCCFSPWLLSSSCSSCQDASCRKVFAFPLLHPLRQGTLRPLLPTLTCKPKQLRGQNMNTIGIQTDSNCKPCNAFKPTSPQPQKSLDTARLAGWAGTASQPDHAGCSEPGPGCIQRGWLQISFQGRSYNNTKSRVTENQSSVQGPMQASFMKALLETRSFRRQEFLFNLTIILASWNTFLRAVGRDLGAWAFGLGVRTLHGFRLLTLSHKLVTFGGQP